MHILFDSAVPILRAYSTDIFTLGQNHECAGLFTAADLVIVKDWSNLKFVNRTLCK